MAQLEQQAAPADPHGSRDPERITTSQAVEELLPQSGSAKEHRGIANRPSESVGVHHRFDMAEGYLSLFARALHLPE